MSDTDELVNKHPLLNTFLSDGEDVTTKGVFGWDTIGNTRIPYILRGEEHHLSVRMVEKKLLSKYPRKYPEEISNRPPLASEFITTAEATVLNKINSDHCQHEFGHTLFTTDDIIVKVQDFKDFFGIVQEHFGDIPPEIEPGEVIKQQPGIRQVTGGWLQVNNTIIPFVYREKSLLKFVPLCVVKYAAELLTDTNINGYELTLEECVILTNLCIDAGLTFKFKRPTKALSINLVCQLSKNVIVKELPKGDPFAHAEHSEDGVVNNQPELTQSIVRPTHTPPKQGIPQSLLPSKRLTYCQNVPVNSHHSPNACLTTQTNHPEVTKDSPSNLFDQTSQAPATQLQPSPRHLEKIEELHNRYLPLVNRSDVTHISQPHQRKIHSQRPKQVGGT